MHNGWYGSEMENPLPNKNITPPTQKCRCGQIIYLEETHGEIRLKIGNIKTAAFLCPKCSEFLKDWCKNA